VFFQLLLHEFYHKRVGSGVYSIVCECHGLFPNVLWNRRKQLPTSMCSSSVDAAHNVQSDENVPCRRFVHVRRVRFANDNSTLLNHVLMNNSGFSMYSLVR